MGQVGRKSMWGFVPHFFFDMADRADEGSRLFQLTLEQVEALGFELVDLRVGGTPQREVVRVLVDLPHSGPGRGISVDQCAVASRALERALEESGLVGPRYRLEVSSPGIERPVRWARHWRQFVGSEVMVRAPRWRGSRRLKIVAVPSDDEVTLAGADGAATTIPLSEVSEATLVVDWDAVIKKKKRKQEQG